MRKRIAHLLPHNLLSAIAFWLNQEGAWLTAVHPFGINK
jgi:hypothetical protein